MSEPRFPSYEDDSFAIAMNDPQNSPQTLPASEPLGMRERTNASLPASKFRMPVLCEVVIQRFPFIVSIGTGLFVEDTFNRNTTLSFTRPYESPIFVSVQEGDIPALFRLLETGQATVHDVDPYGLGLLYVRPPTWSRQS